MIATVMDKVKYLIKKHPEVKVCFENPDGMKVMSQCKNGDKVVLVSRDKDIWKYYLLSKLLNDPTQSVKIISTVELLDAYLNNELSLVRSDIVVIQDSCLYVPNKQRIAMVTEVFDMNTQVIYHYYGDEDKYNQDPIDESVYDVSNLGGRRPVSGQVVEELI